MYTQITLTIPSGAALSNIVDIKQFHAVAIFMPAAWDAAAITFLVGAADPTAGADTTPALGAAGMQSLFDDTGTEVSVTAAASHTIGVGTQAKQAALMPARFLQIRSGNTATPVNQTASRTLILLCKSY